MQQWPENLSVPGSVAGFLGAVGRREPVFDLRLDSSALLVIEKRRYSAFFQTDLELNLRTMGVDTLVITGVHTNLCCEATGRDGFMRDFQVMSVADAQTAITKELHEAALVSTMVTFGRVADTQQVIREFSA